MSPRPLMRLSCNRKRKCSRSDLVEKNVLSSLVGKRTGPVGPETPFERPAVGATTPAFELIVRTHDGSAEVHGKPIDRARAELTSLRSARAQYRRGVLLARRFSAYAVCHRLQRERLPASPPVLSRWASFGRDLEQCRPVPVCLRHRASGCQQEWQGRAQWKAAERFNRPPTAQRGCWQQPR